MSATLWQEVTVALLAGGAVAWLLWRRRRAKSGCDDCKLADAARTLPVEKAPGSGRDT